MRLTNKINCKQIKCNKANIFKTQSIRAYRTALCKYDCNAGSRRKLTCPCSTSVHDVHGTAGSTPRSPYLSYCTHAAGSYRVNILLTWLLPRRVAVQATAGRAGNKREALCDRYQWMSALLRCDGPQLPGNICLLRNQPVQGACIGQASMRHLHDWQAPAWSRQG